MFDQQEMESGIDEMNTTLQYHGCAICKRMSTIFNPLIQSETKIVIWWTSRVCWFCRWNVNDSSAIIL